MIPQSFIEELKMHCDIEEVIGSYVQLKKRGRISSGFAPSIPKKPVPLPFIPKASRFTASAAVPEEM